MLPGFRGIRIDLAPHRSTLWHAIRTDPDPQIHHWAGGLLLVAAGLSLTQSARQIGGSRTRLRIGAQPFLTSGLDGLVDWPRACPPRKRDVAAYGLFERALVTFPLYYA